MKIEQKKINKTKTDQVFSRKLLESGRKISITRSDLRDAPSPMLTDYISDEAMQELLVDIAMKLDNRDQRTIARHDDFDAAFWQDMESVFATNGVPAELPLAGTNVLTIAEGALRVGTARASER